MEPMLGPVLDTSGTARISEDGRRWMAAAGSVLADSRSAGEAAARHALAGTDPRLLMVFSTLTRDPEAVLAGVGAASGDLPVLGCSARRMITPTGPTSDGVVVVALGGPGLEVTTGVGIGVTDEPRDAGAEAARQVLADWTSRPNEVLLLVTDGLAGNQEEVLAGAYSVVGASLPLVGGSSTPDWATGRSFQFYGDKVISDGVLAAIVSSDGPLGIGLGHGWRKVGKPMLVTRSVGRDVFTLDDKPALPAYLEQLGAPPETYTDPVAFKEFARPRPIGIRRRSGEEIRNVNSVAGLSEGWLRAGAEVPEGCLVWVMEGELESVIDGGRDACRSAIEALDGSPPLGFLTFDCVARASMLGDVGTCAEVARMTEVGHTAGQPDPVPLGGLYTCGEIARTSGINGFHNEMVVVLALG
jgi:hypothetical protein